VLIRLCDLLTVKTVKRVRSIRGSALVHITDYVIRNVDDWSTDIFWSQTIVCKLVLDTYAMNKKLVFYIKSAAKCVYNKTK